MSSRIPFIVIPSAYVVIPNAFYGIPSAFIVIPSEAEGTEPVIPQPHPPPAPHRGYRIKSGKTNESVPPRVPDQVRQDE